LNILTGSQIDLTAVDSSHEDTSQTHN